MFNGGLGRQAPGGTLVFVTVSANESRHFDGGRLMGRVRSKNFENFARLGQKKCSHVRLRRMTPCCREQRRESVSAPRSRYRAILGSCSHGAVPPCCWGATTRERLDTARRLQCPFERVPKHCPPQRVARI
jgi:hypothetical protein